MTQQKIMNETAWFGAGALRLLPQEIAQRGVHKAFIVTDKTPLAAVTLRRVTEFMDAHALPWSLCHATVAHLTCDSLAHGVAAFQQSAADYLIAIGGKAVQETTNALRSLITHQHNRQTDNHADNASPATHIIAIPTTAGISAEVTMSYVISDEDTECKFVCATRHNTPKVAIMDAEIMASLPLALKIATAMGALAQAIEGYLTRDAWAVSDMLHLKAIKIISQSLRDAVTSDIDALEQMALGQYISGMGFAEQSLGLVHGMAHPLTEFYNLPEGLAHAILLPRVMAWNAPYTGDKYRDIARVMGVSHADIVSIDLARLAAVDAVKQLCRDVGIPSSLKQAGLREQDIPLLAQAALNDAATAGNPRQPELQDIIVLYHEY